MILFLFVTLFSLFTGMLKMGLVGGDLIIVAIKYYIYATVLRQALQTSAVISSCRSWLDFSEEFYIITLNRVYVEILFPICFLTMTFIINIFIVLLSINYATFSL